MALLLDWLRNTQRADLGGEQSKKASVETLRGRTMRTGFLEPVADRRTHFASKYLPLASRILNSGSCGRSAPTQLPLITS